MKDFSDVGPATLIALTTVVMAPIGRTAKSMQSAMPIAWLMNCMTTRSPKRAMMLGTLRVRLEVGTETARCFVW